jgi:hypothetical protein
MRICIGDGKAAGRSQVPRVGNALIVITLTLRYLHLSEDFT